MFPRNICCRPELSPSFQIKHNLFTPIIFVKSLKQISTVPFEFLHLSGNKLWRKSVSAVLDQHNKCDTNEVLLQNSTLPVLPVHFPVVKIDVNMRRVQTQDE